MWPRLATLLSFELKSHPQLDTPPWLQEPPKIKSEVVELNIGPMRLKGMKQFRFLTATPKKAILLAI